ncbi:hypothetical protein BDW59DRAFT_139481 [Aspergillus cavernicola]|uniref:Zn(2)-C6 fungal-type domain-containing protein n=1 Tax=Aspergillus cavernicola TaxID=176166 RepID=A0ABR4IXW4_9EURO
MGPLDTRQIKRPRVSLSCLVCRTRKVRCGREQPECRNCKKMNKVCVYQNSIPHQSSLVHLQEKSVEQAGYYENHDDTSRPDGAPTATDRNHPDHVQDVPKVTEAEAAMGAKPILKPDLSNAKSAVKSQPRVRHIGDSFFGLKNSPELLDDEPAQDMFPPHIDFTILASVLKSMPIKPICDAFVESFVASVYAIYPLLDLPGFHAWYVDFWKWCNETDSIGGAIPALLLKDMTSICVLFAVLFTGASAAHKSTWKLPNLQFKSESRDTILNDLKASYLNLLAACEHLEHPTLNTITSSLLADTFMGRELDLLTNGLYVSSICRLAQNIGLHRGDRNTDMGHNESARHLHSRIWWHIIWLDVQSSIASGLPTTCRSKLPNAVDILNEIPQENATILEQSPLFSIFLARSEAAGLAHRFLDHIHSTSVMAEEKYHDSVLDAKNLHHRIQTLLDTQESAISPTPWVRMVLKMVQLEVPILLHIPFLRVPSSMDSQDEKWWSRLVRLCVHYLQMYIAVTADISFEPYLWFLSKCSGPTHYTYLVLMYLHHYPHSETSQVGRLCARGVFNYWNAQHENGIPFTEAQKRLLQLYRKLDSPRIEETTAKPALVEHSIDSDYTGEGQFELDMEFLNDIFDIEAFTSD